MFANFSTNFFTFESKFASRIMTSLIFIVALIIRYFFFFFLSIKNQKFRYELWHDFSKSILMRTRNMSMTIWVNARDTKNFETCHVLCSMILIFWSRTIFFRTLSISSKIHDNAFSRLYNIFNSNFFLRSQIRLYDQFVNSFWRQSSFTSYDAKFKCQKFLKSFD